MGSKALQCYKQIPAVMMYAIMRLECILEAVCSESAVFEYLG